MWTPCVSRLIQRGFVKQNVRWLSAESRFRESLSTKEEELEKFESFDWWLEPERIGTLQFLNPARCQFINTSVVSWFGDSVKSRTYPLRGISVLEVGCGGGILTEALGRMGDDILAIDVVEANIHTAKKHLLLDPFLQKNINYECISAETLVEKGRSFDVVVASEVIEHVKDPFDFFKTLSRLVKPHGMILITTLNRTLQSWTGAIMIAEYIARFIPTGTHEWEAFITPQELSMAARQIGLKMEHLAGFEYNWLARKWTLGNNVSINYAASFTKTNSNQKPTS